MIVINNINIARNFRARELKLSMEDEMLLAEKGFIETDMFVLQRLYFNSVAPDIEITKIRVVDQSGTVIEERTEEKMTCSDGAKDFLHGMGIADSCQIFTWEMPLGQTVVTQRAIACHKMYGGYEIVKGYHYIE